MGVLFYGDGPLALGSGKKGEKDGQEGRKSRTLSLGIPVNLVGNGDGDMTGFVQRTLQFVQRVLFEDSIIQMEEGVLFYGNGPLTLGSGKKGEKDGKDGRKSLIKRAMSRKEKEIKRIYNRSELFFIEENCMQRDSLGLQAGRVVRSRDVTTHFNVKKRLIIFVRR